MAVDKPNFPNNVMAALEKSVCEGKLQDDLDAAYTFVEGFIRQQGPFPPKGLAAPILTPTEIKEKLTEMEQTEPEAGANKVLFSGSLAMLDFRVRAAAIEDADVAKIKTACGALRSPADAPDVLGTIPVDADFIDEELMDLRRSDRDESLDAVIFAVSVNPESIAAVIEICRNLVFSALRCGQGLDRKIDRLKKSESEDRERNSMGKSAWNKAKLLLSIIVEARRSGLGDVDLTQSDAALAEALLTKHPELESWKKDTCSRYLQVAGRTEGPEMAALFTSWEFQKGRDTLVDGISILRAACQATKDKDQLLDLLKGLYFEQVCQVRTAIKSRKGREAGGDTANFMQGLVLRRKFYDYVHLMFPKLVASTEHFGNWKYYNKKFNMSESGHLPKGVFAKNDSDDENDADQDQNLEGVSNYPSKTLLVSLCEAVAQNKYEATFTAGARETPTNTLGLDLTLPSFKGLQSSLQHIMASYMTDFRPPTVPQTPTGLQNVGESAMESVRIWQEELSSEEDYLRALSEYSAECTKVEADAINDYMVAQIVCVVSRQSSETLTRKLADVKLLAEPGRKLWLCDLLNQAPVNWNEVKHHKKGIRCDPHIAFVPGDRDTDAGDSLRPLKTAYLQHRNRKQDGKSDDLLAIVVPGEIADKPVNVPLERCHKSLKHMVPPHQEPKIGSIELTNDLELHGRGIFKRKMSHNFVFTSETKYDSNELRKRMKTLNGTTASNHWQVPHTLMSRRLQVTQEEHDQLFAGAQSGDSTASPEEGLEFTIDPSSTKVVPFPFELHKAFVQEVINVWGAKVAIFLETGSGECLHGALMERTKSVAIFKSAAHKKIVWERLTELVKTSGLVQPKLPEKPAAIVQWEAKHKTPGNAGTPLPVVTPSESSMPPNGPAINNSPVGTVLPSTLAAFGMSNLGGVGAQGA